MHDLIGCWRRGTRSAGLLLRGVCGRLSCSCDHGSCHCRGSSWCHRCCLLSTRALSKSHAWMDHQRVVSAFMWCDLLVGAAVVAGIGVTVVLML